MMDITYRFGGFNEVKRIDNLVIFEHDLTNIPAYPDYVTIQLAAEAEPSV